MDTVSIFNNNYNNSQIREVKEGDSCKRELISEFIQDENFNN